MWWAGSAQVLVALTVPGIYVPRAQGEGCNSPPLGIAQLCSMQKATNHIFLLVILLFFIRTVSAQL